MTYASPPPFQIKRNRSSTWFRNIFSTTGIILGAVGIAAFLNLFVFQSYYVEGESMSPTLHTDNRLIVSKVERSFSNVNSQPYIPQRGQIVVINGNASPGTSQQAPELIKRVVGLPGDTLTIKNGTVTITNQSAGSFDVDQSLGLDLGPTYAPSDITISIPEGKVYVLGDNRSEGGSLDSRVFGLVDADLIDGRLWARIMPFDMGRVF